MTGDLRVDFGGLDATSHAINTGGATLRGKLDELESGLKPMMAEWDGFARNAYHAAQQRWNAAANDLNQILLAVGINVNDSNTGYQDTEKLNTSMW